MEDHVRLITELKTWQKTNPRKLICLGETVTEDGRLILEFSINGTEFHLLCPPNYPDHEDCFFMETECRDFWCVALNEFIIDSPHKLTLDVILAKIFLYYTPGTKKPVEELFSSENESDCDFSDCSEDLQADIDDEWEFLISKKKREWREKEGQLRLRYNRPKISDMFDGKILDHPQQVFSNSAASAILINDLIDVMGSKESNGIVVDTVENDVCRWSVVLEDFEAGSLLSEDLEKTAELYGYNNVQLRLNFTMDSYPSHPPSMTIIRPKLLNVFRSEDSVKFGNWNPARNMMSVIKEVKEYIVRNGRVDFQSKRNGVNVNAVAKLLVKLADAIKNENKSWPGKDEASYSAYRIAAQNVRHAGYDKKRYTGSNDSSTFCLEEGNTRLEIILTELLRCLKECEDEYSESETHFTFNLSLNHNGCEKRNYESRFTADSNCPASTFQAMKQLLETKKLEPSIRSCDIGLQRVDPQWNEKYCNIITNPSFGLTSSKSEAISGLQNEKYFVTDGPEDKKNKSNNSEQKYKTNVEHSVISSFNVNVKTIREFPTIASNNSSLEYNANMSYVYKTVQESVLIPFIRRKLSVDTFFEIWLATSLYSKLIQIVSQLASNLQLNSLLYIRGAQDQSIADIVYIHGEKVKLILEKLVEISDGQLGSNEDLDKTELAEKIIELSKLLKNTNQNPTDESFSKLNKPNRSEDRIYSRELLNDLKFSKCDIDLETHALKHSYESDIDTSRSYFRMAQEFALLTESLRIKCSSGIYVRTDNTKPFLMRALITGTKGTICGGGCFSFDIYLKKDYPNDGVEIMSTTFRDGEKTTSRLNDRTTITLQEDKTNTFAKSTILQVLTSIKIEKLIPLELLGENWDNGLAEGAEQNQTLLISKIIKFAMIDKMRRPTPGFEQVIRTHFRINRDQILSELERYEFLQGSELLASLKKEFERLSVVKI